MKTTIKIQTLLALTALLALCAGCVNTLYQKTVSVTKDADGKITQTVETETVVQKNQQGWPMKMELIKGVQPGGPK